MEATLRPLAAWSFRDVLLGGAGVPQQGQEHGGAEEEGQKRLQGPGAQLVAPWRGEVPHHEGEAVPRPGNVDEQVRGQHANHSGDGHRQPPGGARRAGEQGNNNCYGVG